ncbi:ABC transporter substrate-binding protein [Paenibacillus sp. 598K]|uniref:ABC transporter substrate-binding protein n=1 Tax=Paenibacillus sp. 598K TaxID=1117987 RepID=UPI000FFB04C7|nr:ABC transporter substrate-binding protein [Paenibacillus sp. 598K]GBF78402.1 ABC transporter substrate-binding protein [Paenibacillus sp. 598K]
MGYTGKQRRYRAWIAMMLIAIMATLAACGGKAEEPRIQEPGVAVDNGGDNAAPSNGGDGEASGATQYPITVTDATDVELTLEAAPQAIVSLVPSETEVLFAIGAGGEVVGVDEWSNYPEEVAAITKIGDMSTNIEAVAALNPDLVVASASMNAQALEELRRLEIPVFTSNPKTLDETIAHIEQMGQLLDRQDEATLVAQQMRDAKAQVVEAVKDAPHKRVYLEFSPGWSVGRGEFLDELLTLAGGVNVAGDEQGWFEIDPEQVLQSNPEIIIYPDFGGDMTIPDLIASRPGWEAIDAVRNGELHEVTNDPLVRVGPRLTDGLLELARAIHPDRFE